MRVTARPGCRPGPYPPSSMIFCAPTSSMIFFAPTAVMGSRGFERLAFGPWSFAQKSSRRRNPTVCTCRTSESEHDRIQASCFQSQSPSPTTMSGDHRRKEPVSKRDDRWETKGLRLDASSSVKAALFFSKRARRGGDFLHRGRFTTAGQKGKTHLYTMVEFAANRRFSPSPSTQGKGATTFSFRLRGLAVVRGPSPRHTGAYCKARPAHAPPSGTFVPELDLFQPARSSRATAHRARTTRQYATALLTTEQ